MQVHQSIIEPKECSFCHFPFQPPTLASLYPTNVQWSDLWGGTASQPGYEVLGLAPAVTWSNSVAYSLWYDILFHVVNIYWEPSMKQGLSHIFSYFSLLTTLWSRHPCFYEWEHWPRDDEQLTWVTQLVMAELDDRLIIKQKVWDHPQLSGDSSQIGKAEYFPRISLSPPTLWPLYPFYGSAASIQDTFLVFRKQDPPYTNSVYKKRGPSKTGSPSHWWQERG